MAIKVVVCLFRRPIRLIIGFIFIISLRSFDNINDYRGLYVLFVFQGDRACNYPTRSNVIGYR